MKRFLLILAAFVSLNACTVYGLTNDYGKLSDDEKQLITRLDNFDHLAPKKIYTVNAQQLKSELRRNDKSLVYLFTNGCTTDLCLPMSTYEDYADKNGYKLYLVMSGYAKLQETLQQRFESPLFAIDYAAYDTKLRPTAWKRFENDLRGLPLNTRQKEYEGNLFFFEKGRLIKVTEELPTSNISKN